MSEVLSQSQIDALLNAVRSGEKDLEEEPKAKEEKQYRKYDFSSPRKFTKDRIKMLRSIFDSYTRQINTRLNAMLHSNCAVTVESVEEQRYYEFSNALTEGSVLALANVELKDKVEETPLMFFLDTTIALNMMDRMMGGEGTAGDDVDSEYNFTDLELLLYEHIVTDLIGAMSASWENYIQLGFHFEKVETDPTLNQVISLDETIIIVDMKVEVENCQGRLSICLPGMTLTNIFAEINRDNPGRRAQGEDKGEEIFETLRDSMLDVVANLGTTQLSLRDLYHLSVGDVIDLGKPKSEPVYLEIGGYQWFTGRMGTHKKNMAIKIEESCYQDEQRSE